MWIVDTKGFPPLSFRIMAAFAVVCLTLCLLSGTTVHANDAYSTTDSIHSLNNSHDDTLLISLLTNRITDIKERASNPTLPKSERQRLQKELDLLTDMLSNILTRATGHKRTIE